MSRFSFPHKSIQASSVERFVRHRRVSHSALEAWMALDDQISFSQPSKIGSSPVLKQQEALDITYTSL